MTKSHDFPVVFIPFNPSLLLLYLEGLLQYYYCDSCFIVGITIQIIHYVCPGLYNVHILFKGNVHVCTYIYIYMCVCVVLCIIGDILYIYIYIYIYYQRLYVGI